MNGSRVLRFAARMSGVLKLGKGARAKAKLLAGFLWFTTHSKIGMREASPWRFRFTVMDKDFVVHLSNIFEMETAREIFIDEEYSTDAREPKIVLDLGSNIGLSAIYFSLKYPQAQIHAYEPDPNAFAILQRATAPFENIRAHAMAIAGKDGERQFYSNTKNRLSSSLLQRESESGSILVQVRSLDSVVNEMGIESVDLVKFDIEGAEYESFSSFKRISKVRHYVGEVHGDLIPATMQDFFGLFGGFKMNIRELPGGKRYSMKAARI